MKEETIAIVDWYRSHGRDLPWRHTHDPYAIWLSEIILQQTRIAQGLAYWERFMTRWPRVEDLAAATEDEVLREWLGLGYYSRARHLHEAARQIVALGHFPDTCQKLRKLSGVGDYTAAAVASFAFGESVAAVDGNFYRVLSRCFAIDTPIDSVAGKKQFRELADKMVKCTDASADFNSGVMDLGATVCTPSMPACEGCPLREYCRARKTGSVEQYPVKSKKTAVKTRRLLYVYVRCQGYTAIRRRGAGDIWQGLWEPVEATESLTHGAQLIVHDVRHVLTHRILLADLWLLDTEERPALPDGYIWVREEELGHYALPRLVEKLFGSLPEH